MTRLDARYLPLLLVGLFALFSAIYNAYLPLYLDEAYYWIWSKHLDLGYFDHPFMIAVLIKVATLFGDSAFAIRMVSVFCVSVGAWFVYLTARRAFDDKTALAALAIFLCSPATTMGFTIASPDAPLVLFWSAALYFSYRAVFEDDLKSYILAGSFIGLGMSSKYTAILFLGFLGLFLLIRRPRLFLSPKPWFAIIMALVFFMPTVYWNYEHDWISFAFQFKHGTNESFRLDFGHFFEFFGGLFLLFSPIFFGYFLYLFGKTKQWFCDDKLLFFALSGVFIITFFLYKALFLKMQLNWVAPAFIGLGIFIARFIVTQNAKKLLMLALGFSLILSFAVRFPSAIGLKGEKNFHSRIYGFKELSEEMKKFARADDKIFADHLTTAYILSFYMPEHGEAMIPTPSRASMFDMWQAGFDFATMHGIYESDSEQAVQLAKIWHNVELIEIFQTGAPEYKNKKFYIYRVSN